MDGAELADVIRTAKEKARRRRRPLYLTGTVRDPAVAEDRPSEPCVAVYPGGRVEVLGEPAEGK